MKNVYKIAFGGLVFLFVSIAAADVQLAAILSDNMVMQRETEAPVWGWADPGERITVQGSWKAEAIAVADADGLWSLKIRLSFDYTGTGLKTRDGRDVSHLAIAGADKRFVKAKGVIDGDTVVVFSDTISKPVAVRYGWSNTANPNLANKEGLPASSFRTDFEVR